MKKIFLILLLLSTSAFAQHEHMGEAWGISNSNSNNNRNTNSSSHDYDGWITYKETFTKSDGSWSSSGNFATFSDKNDGLTYLSFSYRPPAGYTQNECFCTSTNNVLSSNNITAGSSCNNTGGSLAFFRNYTNRIDAYDDVPDGAQCVLSVYFAPPSPAPAQITSPSPRYNPFGYHDGGK